MVGQERVIMVVGRDMQMNSDSKLWRRAQELGLKWKDTWLMDPTGWATGVVGAKVGNGRM